MIQTDQRPIDLDELVDSSFGGGGDWWPDGDSGGGWGWWEDPGHDDENPYRRSRIMRIAALITVVAVVLGSIGTFVVFVATGSAAASFSVSSVRATLPRSGVTAAPSALVTFVVSNQTSISGVAACQATLTTKGATVGAGTVRLGSLPGGQSAVVNLHVALDPTRISGEGPATPRVSCAPSAHRAG